MTQQTLQHLSSPGLAELAHSAHSRCLVHRALGGRISASTQLCLVVGCECWKSLQPMCIWVDKVTLCEGLAPA